MTYQSAQPSLIGQRWRLMCLVYIRCLFCEASGTSSVGCFVCDLHRFSIKLNGSVKQWKTWYAYFKYTTRMGYVPPPRRLRYRTNLFVIVGLVQRIDDVLLRHNCILNCILKFVSSQSWNPKYYCLQPFLWNNWTNLSKLFSCITRRTKLWCGLITLLTLFSTWMRLEVESPLVWNLWILLPMGQQDLWIWASWAAAGWASLEGCCLFHAWEAMVVIWTMIDDMRSWFGRREFDPLWVLRRCWFVEEEDRLRLSQMKCYSGSVCSCKVYGSCREIYGRPPRNSWELGFLE